MAKTVKKLAEGEEILWESAPCYKSYSIHKLLSGGIPTFLFAAFGWTLVGILFGVFLMPAQNPQNFYPYTNASMLTLPILIGLFFSIPIPVWVVDVIFIRRTWEQTYYLITNQRVIIQTAGIVRREIRSNFMKKITGVFMKTDWLDRKFNTGTVKLMFRDVNLSHDEDTVQTGREAALTEIRHVNDVDFVFAKLQKLLVQNRKKK
jgi:hypothetical protein